MDFKLYRSLSEEQLALCEEIERRAAEWNLPVTRKKNFIGFGKQHGFYMFWIAHRDGQHYFKARRMYVYRQTDSIVHYELSVENRDGILDAMGNVFRDYEARGRLPAECDETPMQTFAFSWHEIAQSALQASIGQEEAPEDASCLGADEFALCTDRVLMLLCDEMRNQRVREMWQRYVLDDKATLRSIAQGCTITHERVRQLAKKGDLTLAKMFRRYCKKGESETFCACLEHMISLIEEVGGALIPFLEAAFGGWGKRKRAFVLRLLFGEEEGERLLQLLDRFRQQQGKPAREEAHAAKKEVGGKSSKKLFSLDEIHYPTSIWADTEKEIRSFPMEREYSHVARFRRKLENLEPEISFVQNPNIVYYSSTQTDHRPDFLLEMSDGRRVLVMVLPIINMGFSYNLVRIEALQRFCEENGYGHLIVDPSGRNFSEIKEISIESSLCEKLTGILDEKGKILWSDICELKKNHDVKNETIVAYVLQEDLTFTMNPYFWIRRKAGRFQKQKGEKK